MFNFAQQINTEVINEINITTCFINNLIMIMAAEKKYASPISVFYNAMCKVRST